MEFKNAVYQTPVPSTDFSTESFLSGHAVQFAYYRGDVEYKSGIRFNSVKATRTRAESACTPWHIEGAYDTLVEITDSAWANEVRAETAERQRRLSEEWAIKHYMIYLDSVGCYEFLAESWEALPEAPVTVTQR